MIKKPRNSFIYQTSLDAHWVLRDFLLCDSLGVQRIVQGPLKFCFSNMYYWIIAEQYVPSFIYWTSKDVLWGIRDFSWCSIPLEFRELCKDLCNFVLNSNNALLNYTFYVSIWFSNSCPTNVIFGYVTMYFLNISIW